MKTKKTETLKIKTGNVATASEVTGTINGIVFCRNGVIKLKKHDVKSKL